MIVLSVILIISCIAYAVADNTFGKKEIIYVYSKTCRACMFFKPIYNQFKDSHKSGAKFVELDADTFQGRSFVIDNRISHIPFILMVNNDKKYVPSGMCMFDYQCLNDMYNDVMK